MHMLTHTLQRGGEVFDGDVVVDLADARIGSHALGLVAQPVFCKSRLNAVTSSQRLMQLSP